MGNLFRDNIYNEFPDPNKKIEEVGDQVSDVNSKVNILSNVGVNIESFPRLSVEVDDTERFKRAYNALPSGGKLFIPNNTYIVTSLTFTKTVNIIGSYATLKLADGVVVSDFILSLKGDYSKIEGVWFDGNKANTTSNTGRAEGLRLEGSYCVAYKCLVKDTVNTAFANTFVNMGKHNTFDSCVSLNAGYAGFANSSGDYLTLKKCQAINFRIKGFKHNGNGNLIVLDDCYFETNTTDPASDGILFDSGAGSSLAIARVTRCTVKGTLGSNSLKCEFVDKVTIEDSELLGTGSIYGINFQDSVREADITRVKLNGYLRVMEKTDLLTVNNLRIVTDSTKTENINFCGKEFVANGLYLEGAQNGIRIEALHASGKQSLVLDNVELNASSSSAKLFRPITFLGTDHLTVKRYKVTNGDSSLFSGLTGTSANEKQVQRSPRIFYHSNLPTAGVWQLGDIIYNYNPTPNNYVGWVCTTGGTTTATAWVATTAYTVNSLVSSGGKVYKCTVAGTSSSTAPTHTSGTATDGTVTWQYVDVLGVFKGFGLVQV